MYKISVPIKRFFPTSLLPNIMQLIGGNNGCVFSENM